MSGNPHQLFLLADHIKLSLLERQRAVSLQLEPNSQDGEISRSLESLREGLEAVEAQARRRQEGNDDSAADLQDQANHLRLQYQDLASQFSCLTGNAANNNDTSSPAVDDDSNIPHASNITTTLKHPKPQHPMPKSVRFTDDALVAEADDDPNRNALLPYRDSPSPSYDHSNLSNEQIHQEHARIIRDQDDQLDRLGESIGRQHQLSIQIGDELEDHVMLLDDLDGHVDRHQSRLDGARRRLGRFSRRAKESGGLMTIIGLIIVLVILIVILK